MESAICIIMHIIPFELNRICFSIQVCIQYQHVSAYHVYILQTKQKLFECTTEATAWTVLVHVQLTLKYAVWVPIAIIRRTQLRMAIENSVSLKTAQQSYQPISNYS